MVGIAFIGFMVKTICNDKKNSKNEIKLYFYLEVRKLFYVGKYQVQSEGNCGDIVNMLNKADISFLGI